MKLAPPLAQYSPSHVSESSKGIKAHPGDVSTHNHKGLFSSLGSLTRNVPSSRLQTSDAVPPIPTARADLGDSWRGWGRVRG